MDVNKAADSTIDDTELSKNLEDLTVKDSHDEKKAANGKKRKNHRGGQKKRQKNGQTSSQGAAPVKLYEVRETGTKGLGVFAKCVIPRGTRIMCEPALLYIETAYMQFMHILFYKLSPADQAKLLSLHGIFPKAQKTIMEKVLRTFKAEDPMLFAPPIEDHLRIMAVVKSNSCRTHNGVAIPYDLGRINHSCLPNVHHAWNNMIERATVHAVQDIAAGQELLTAYIDTCQPRAQRQSYLLQRWGFRCDCQACKPSSTFGKASEKRRKRLSDIRKFLESRKHATSMKAGTSDGTALAAAIEFAELLQEEGIHNMELATAYEDVANINLNMGNLKAASEWQGKAMEVAAACAGTDYDTYPESEATMAKIQQLMSQGGTSTQTH
ncbi:MAG: hypothetical protein LQ349_008102 [Xanthoria aureola]|nr:MAG: hypothetical protein LQ349_008102 [Xanthoria aureola]